MRRKFERFKYQSDCPFCGEEIGWSQKPQLRKRVICAACKSMSELVSISPLELDEPSWFETRKGGSSDRKMRQSREKGHLVFIENDEWDEDELGMDLPSDRRIR